MSLNPFGLNIHLRYVKDIGKLHERMRAINPAVCVVMVDDNPPGKEDQTPYIKEFATHYPNTLIVARVKHDHDAGYHTPPVGDPLNRKYIASPTDFLNKWGDLGRGNMSLYALNEPLASEAITDPEIARLIEWCQEVIEQAVGRGISLTLPNFGMGQPALNAALNEWDARFDPLLKLLSKHRHNVFLGVHEYGDEEPYHWGRLMFMLARCKALNIPAPKVVISEFGVDATTSERNGYKARGWSGDHYMRQLAQVYKRVYMPLVDQGIVKGTCLFSYGNSGGWHSFDVEDDKAFWDTLTGIIGSGGLKPTKPIPAPVPAPTPEPPPPPPVLDPPPIEHMPPPPLQAETDMRRIAAIHAEMAALEMTITEANAALARLRAEIATLAAKYPPLRKSA